MRRPRVRAVQAARESATRSQCVNGQQQLGALYQFIPKSIDSLSNDYLFNAVVAGANPPLNNLQVVQTRIPTLTCPSD